MWDNPVPGTREDHLYIANIHDNPPGWQPFAWLEPGHGQQVFGEMHTIRGSGSTGDYRCGLWRTGVGMPGCAPDGSAQFSSTSQLGDETMLLLEGRARIVNEETDEGYDLKGGDVLALPAGLPVRWHCKPPFLKLFRVITRA